MTRSETTPKKLINKQPIENRITMKTLKTISLIAATFLTVALSSPAVKAGRIPFDGTWEANEVSTLFGDPPIGFFSNGQGTLTSTELGQLSLYLVALVDLTTLEGLGSARLIAANGDSIFAYEAGVAVPTEPNVFHITETFTVAGGTGQYANARGTFNVDRTIDLSTGDSSGTFNGVIIERGDH
jgi:hypothetical protein